VTSRVLGAAILLAIGASSASAQRELPVGARVRVALPELQAQQENRMQKVQFIRGVLERVSGDTLFVRPSPLTSEVAIPLIGVYSLQRSRGVPRRIPSAIGTGIGGAIVFALNAAIFYSDNRTFSADSRTEAMGNAAQFGGVVFGIVGFIWPAERWRRVPLD
jgi:hypothetical protein